MPERAQVRSLEAIDDFRAHLVVYLAKVRPLLDEIGADLRRTQAWIETDGRHLAERDLQRRSRALEEAQQALLSARLSSFREATVMEQTAVHTARRAVAQVEERLRRIRTWQMAEFPLFPKAFRGVPGISRDVYKGRRITHT